MYACLAVLMILAARALASTSDALDQPTFEGRRRKYPGIARTWRLWRCVISAMSFHSVLAPFLEIDPSSTSVADSRRCALVVAPLVQNTENSPLSHSATAALQPCV